MLLPQDQFNAREVGRAIWAPEDLPDHRLYDRLLQSIDMLVRRTNSPTSEQPRADRRGFQRFYRNERIDPKCLADKGDAYAVEMLRGLDLCIVPHDTTEVDLCGAWVPDDAGALRSSHARGYLVHNAIAIHPHTGAILASLDSFAWTRGRTLHHQDHKERKPQQRESLKWRSGIRRVVNKVNKAKLSVRLVHVFDAEGTTHENFTFARHDAHWFIARVTEERLIVEGKRKLWAHVQAQPAELTWTTSVRTAPSKAAVKAARKAAEQGALKEAQQAGEQAVAKLKGNAQTTREAAKRARKARLAVLRRVGDEAVSRLMAEVRALGQVRQVELQVQHAAVTLTPKDGRRPVRVQAVSFREVGAPDNVEPVEWMLLTTCPVKTPADALRIGHWYKMRYGIEEVHKVLKTGLHMEDEPFDNIRSFRRYLAIAGPIATQLVRWREVAKESPQALASDHVEAEVIDALKEACRFRGISLPRRAWTLADFVVRLAQLGGYERRPDREPGWQVIWRGWRRLQEFIEIYKFAQSGEKKARKKRSVPE